MGPSPLLPQPPGSASSATFQAAADPSLSSSARPRGWALAFSLREVSRRTPASWAPPKGGCGWHPQRAGRTALGARGPLDGEDLRAG